MASINFVKYLRKFENEIILEGVKQGTIGANRLITCRPVPFDSSRFAREMGRYLPFEEPIVLDYYGYYKKSKGFIEALKLVSNGSAERQVKSITCMTVHFASLKIEEISQITTNSHLLSRYVDFKKMVLSKRGFRGNGNGKQ